MGLKIEYIIIVFIIAILAIASIVKLENKKLVNNMSTKEVEFINTTFTEVDTNKTIGIAYGTKGIRDNSILTVENFRYHSDSVKLLRSDEAIYKLDKIYLNNNVILNKELGHNCYSEHAMYDKTLEILHITSPFKAEMDNDVSFGTYLRYYLKRKEMFATNVSAIIYTK